MTSVKPHGEVEQGLDLGERLQLHVRPKDEETKSLLKKLKLGYAYEMILSPAAHLNTLTQRLMKLWNVQHTGWPITLLPDTRHYPWLQSNVWEPGKAKSITLWEIHMMMQKPECMHFLYVIDTAGPLAAQQQNLTLSALSSLSNVPIDSSFQGRPLVEGYHGLHAFTNSGMVAAVDDEVEVMGMTRVESPIEAVERPNRPTSRASSRPSSGTAIHSICPDLGMQLPFPGYTTLAPFVGPGGQLFTVMPYPLAQMIPLGLAGAPFIVNSPANVGNLGPWSTGQVAGQAGVKVVEASSMGSGQGENDKPLPSKGSRVSPPSPNVPRAPTLETHHHQLGTGVYKVASKVALGPEDEVVQLVPCEKVLSNPARHSANMQAGEGQRSGRAQLVNGMQHFNTQRGTQSKVAMEAAASTGACRPPAGVYPFCSVPQPGPAVVSQSHSPRYFNLETVTTELRQHTVAAPTQVTGTSSRLLQKVAAIPSQYTAASAQGPTTTPGITAGFRSGHELDVPIREFLRASSGAKGLAGSLPGEVGRLQAQPGTATAKLTTGATETFQSSSWTTSGLHLPEVTPGSMFAACPQDQNRNESLAAYRNRLLARAAALSNLDTTLVPANLNASQLVGVSTSLTHATQVVTGGGGAAQPGVRMAQAACQNPFPGFSAPGSVPQLNATEANPATPFSLTLSQPNLSNQERGITLPVQPPSSQAQLWGDSVNTPQVVNIAAPMLPHVSDSTATCTQDLRVSESPQTFMQMLGSVLQMPPPDHWPLSPQNPTPWCLGGSVSSKALSYSDKILTGSGKRAGSSGTLTTNSAVGTPASSLLRDRSPRGSPFDNTPASKPSRIHPSIAAAIAELKPAKPTGSHDCISSGSPANPGGYLEGISPRIGSLISPSSSNCMPPPGLRDPMALLNHGKVDLQHRGFSRQEAAAQQVSQARPLVEEAVMAELRERGALGLGVLQMQTPELSGQAAPSGSLLSLATNGWMGKPALAPVNVLNAKIPSEVPLDMQSALVQDQPKPPQSREDKKQHDEQQKDTTQSAACGTPEGLEDLLGVGSSSPLLSDKLPVTQEVPLTLEGSTTGTSFGAAIEQIVQGGSNLCHDNSQSWLGRALAKDEANHPHMDACAAVVAHDFSSFIETFKVDGLGLSAAHEPSVKVGDAATGLQPDLLQSPPESQSLAIIPQGLNSPAAELSPEGSLFDLLQINMESFNFTTNSLPNTFVLSPEGRLTLSPGSLFLCSTDTPQASKGFADFFRHLLSPAGRGSTHSKPSLGQPLPEGSPTRTGSGTGTKKARRCLDLQMECPTARFPLPLDCIDTNSKDAWQFPDNSSSLLEVLVDVCAKSSGPPPPTPHLNNARGLSDHPWSNRVTAVALTGSTPPTSKAIDGSAKTPGADGPAELPSPLKMAEQGSQDPAQVQPLLVEPPATENLPVESPQLGHKGRAGKVAKPRSRTRRVGKNQEKDRPMGEAADEAAPSGHKEAKTKNTERRSVAKRVAKSRVSDKKQDGVADGGNTLTLPQSPTLVSVKMHQGGSQAVQQFHPEVPREDVPHGPSEAACATRKESIRVDASKVVEAEVCAATQSATTKKESSASREQVIDITDFSPVIPKKKRKHVPPPSNPGTSFLSQCIAGLSNRRRALTKEEHQRKSAPPLVKEPLAGEDGGPVSCGEEETPRREVGVLAVDEELQLAPQVVQAASIVVGPEVSAARAGGCMEGEAIRNIGLVVPGQDTCVEHSCSPGDKEGARGSSSAAEVTHKDDSELVVVEATGAVGEHRRGSSDPHSTPCAAAAEDHGQMMEQQEMAAGQGAAIELSVEHTSDSGPLVKDADTIHFSPSEEDAKVVPSLDQQGGDLEGGQEGTPSERLARCLGPEGGHGRPTMCGAALKHKVDHLALPDHSSGSKGENKSELPCFVSAMEHGGREAVRDVCEPAVHGRTQQISLGLVAASGDGVGGPVPVIPQEQCSTAAEENMLAAQHESMKPGMTAETGAQQAVAEDVIHRLDPGLPRALGKEAGFKDELSTMEQKDSEGNTDVGVKSNEQEVTVSDMCLGSSVPEERTVSLDDHVVRQVPSADRPKGMLRYDEHYDNKAEKGVGVNALVRKGTSPLRGEDHAVVEGVEANKLDCAPCGREEGEDHLAGQATRLPAVDDKEDHIGCNEEKEQLESNSVMGVLGEVRSGQEVGRVSCQNLAGRKRPFDDCLVDELHDGHRGSPKQQRRDGVVEAPTGPWSDDFPNVSTPDAGGLGDCDEGIVDLDVAVTPGKGLMSDEDWSSPGMDATPCGVTSSCNWLEADWELEHPIPWTSVKTPGTGSSVEAPENQGPLVTPLSYHCLTPPEQSDGDIAGSPVASRCGFDDVRSKGATRKSSAEIPPFIPSNQCHTGGIGHAAVGESTLHDEVNALGESDVTVTGNGGSARPTSICGEPAAPLCPTVGLLAAPHCESAEEGGVVTMMGMSEAKDGTHQGYQDPSPGKGPAASGFAIDELAIVNVSTSPKSGVGGLEDPKTVLVPRTAVEVDKEALNVAVPAWVWRPQEDDSVELEEIDCSDDDDVPGGGVVPGCVGSTAPAVSLLGAVMSQAQAVFSREVNEPLGAADHSEGLNVAVQLANQMAPSARVAEAVQVDADVHGVHGVAVLPSAAPAAPLVVPPPAQPTKKGIQIRLTSQIKPKPAPVKDNNDATNGGDAALGRLMVSCPDPPAVQPIINKHRLALSQVQTTSPMPVAAVSGGNCTAGGEGAEGSQKGCQQGAREVGSVSCERVDFKQLPPPPPLPSLRWCPPDTSRNEQLCNDEDGDMEEGELDVGPKRSDMDRPRSPRPFKRKERDYSREDDRVERDRKKIHRSRSPAPGQNHSRDKLWTRHNDLCSDKNRRHNPRDGHQDSWERERDWKERGGRGSSSGADGGGGGGGGHPRRKSGKGPPGGSHQGAGRQDRRGAPPPSHGRVGSHGHKHRDHHRGHR